VGFLKTLTGEKPKHLNSYHDKKDLKGILLKKEEK